MNTKSQLNGSRFLGRLLGGALWLPVAALFVVPIGCDEGELPPENGDESAAVTPEAEVGEEAVAERSPRGEGRHHGRHNKRGHGMRHHDTAGRLLKTALKELELNDEQRTALEGLREKARDGKGKRIGRGGDGGGHHDVLIKALETGELDEAACQAKREGHGGKIEQKLAERNARLATLHSTLTPEQRATLVEKVRAGMADKAERHGDKGRRGHHRQGHHGPQMLKKLTAGLGLSPDQQARIDALVEQAAAQGPSNDDFAEKIEEKKARTAALLDAFAADGFDPAMLEAPEPMGDKRAGKSCHMDQVKGLIDILTVEQRQALAEQLKSKPFGKGMGGCPGKRMGGCDGMGDCPGKRMGDCPGKRMGGCDQLDVE